MKKLDLQKCGLPRLLIEGMDPELIPKLLIREAQINWV